MNSLQTKKQARAMWKRMDAICDKHDRFIKIALRAFKRKPAKKGRASFSSVELGKIQKSLKPRFVGHMDSRAGVLIKSK